MTRQKATAKGLLRTKGKNGIICNLPPIEYSSLLADLKSRVRAAQLQAVFSVNRELILLYWDIGRIICEAQKTKGYGRKVVERLANDLQKEFLGTAGFSPQNVWFMRSFYLAWPAIPGKLSQVVRKSKTAILSQPVRESANSALPPSVSALPWGHNRLLLTKLESPELRRWYARRPLRMAGPARCSRITLKRNCRSAKEEPSTIFDARCRRPSLISLNKHSKTPTISIFSLCAATRTNMIWSKDCWITSGDFYSNSVLALRL
jgi:hypothetical protein